jgi:type IV pilus assembly protein PilX
MSTRPPLPIAQSGMTLIVVLMLMSALAVGGLYSARSALMGERLARNQLDNQVARQAAEAALRDAEKDLTLADGALVSGAVCPRGSLARPVSVGSVTFMDASCLAGQCPTMTQDDQLQANFATADGSTGQKIEAWWPTSKGGKWNNANTKPAPGNNAACATFTGGVPIGTFTGANQIAGVWRQPEYLIERIQRSTNTVYRITSRGFGYRSGTEVVMQSYFVVPEL